MTAIDDEIERIASQSAAIVRKLGDSPTRTLGGAIAKLNVVAHVIDPDDYPSAHDVLLGAIEDLRAIDDSA